MCWAALPDKYFLPSIPATRKKAQNIFVMASARFEWTSFPNSYAILLRTIRGRLLTCPFVQCDLNIDDALAFLSTYACFRSSGLMGSLRMRFPVAAKIALHTAGESGGKAGSPMPPIESVLGMM